MATAVHRHEVVMKPRSSLNAGEGVALLEYLQRRLDGAGLATQPEVATKILNLVSNPDSGLRDYSDAIRTDASLAGRLLRTANSAFFAQRQPVTNLDRACVLLGLERLKAISLGFYLSRSAIAEANAPLSRRVWGESLFRACLMAELGRQVVPGHIPEAFVVGLMMDAGIPLLAKWIGPPAERILAHELFPAEQFRAEFAALPYTHVDVVSAMARRWRLPDLLTKPIERHHIEPGGRMRCEPVHQLHRLAYCVGMVRLDQDQEAPAPDAAERLLGVNATVVTGAVKAAAREHTAMLDMFRDIASFSGDAGAIADRAHIQLVDVLDDAMISSLRRETRGSPEAFSIGGHRVEIEPMEDGQAMAYLADTRGRRLVSHSFNPLEHDAKAVMDALGLESTKGDQSAELDTHIRSLAA
jgi:HD-like signal output (HDOD) protein